MKSKLLFGAGIAAGYVLGSRSGRAAYDKLKARAAGIWDSKPVQDKVTAATEAVKEKAPEGPLLSRSSCWEEGVTGSYTGPLQALPAAATVSPESPGGR